MKVKAFLGILLLGLLIVGAVINFGEKQGRGVTENEEKQDITGNSDEEVIPPDKMVKTGPNIGKVAPNFELETLSGDKLKLSDLRGKNVLINFWATWCGPCIEEMPAINEIYHEYRDQDFEVVAVNMTKFEYKREEIKPFVEGLKLSFPVVLEKEGDVIDQYQVYNIPTSYFIDKNGIVKAKAGPMTYEQLNNIYQKAFN
jgi:thiol-disulfide isomerase/thioredoxin